MTLSTELKGKSNITITIRDDDTGNEKQTKLSLFEAERKHIFMAVEDMIIELGVVDERKPRE